MTFQNYELDEQNYFPCYYEDCFDNYDNGSFTNENSLSTTENPDIDDQFSKSDCPEKSESIYTISKEKKMTNEESINKNKKKTHTKLSKDNKICKIKACFLNYLMSYINQIIKTYFDNQKFKIWKIDGKTEVNSNATKKFNQILFNKTIKEVFSENLSEKYKTKNKNQNRDNIKTLETKYPFFKELFQIQYYEFYKYNFICQNTDKNKQNNIQNCLRKLTNERGKKIQKLKMNNLDTFIEYQNKNSKHDPIYLNDLKTMALNLFSFFDLHEYITPNQPITLQPDLIPADKNIKYEETLSSILNVNIKSNKLNTFNIDFNKFDEPTLATESENIINNTDSNYLSNY